MVVKMSDKHVLYGAGKTAYIVQVFRGDRQLCEHIAYADEGNENKELMLQWAEKTANEMAEEYGVLAKDVYYDTDIDTLVEEEYDYRAELDTSGWPPDTF